MSEVKGTKALELWCKRLIKDCPDIQIDNMTTSWRNGMAFCALVHHFRPDLIDVSKLKPENIYENNQLAYSIAEKHLGIPSLLDPEDMVENDVPDRLSVLTYLSQFYQRLGHTVNTKASESEHKVSSSVSTTQIETPFKFGKVALDKCAVCGLPVYLAQRLIVAQKLYHRRCFRCSKCSGHLNPKNFHVIDSTNFSCDACKNEKAIPKFLNNNDQIGMLAFSNDVNSRQIFQNEELVTPKAKPRPQSILEKISMFEKNIEKDNISIEDKVGNISIKANFINKYKDVLKSNEVDIKNNKYEIQNNETSTESSLKDKTTNNSDIDTDENIPKLPTPVYKSNKEKFIFLQTQLSDDALDASIINSTKEDNSESIKNYDSINSAPFLPPDENNDIKDNVIEEESNITDDNRIVQNNGAFSVNLNASFKLNENNFNLNESQIENTEPIKVEEEITISVPPRRKKQILADKKSKALNAKQSPINKEYPDHLNPFSDDENEHDQQEDSRKISTNPFGSSDDEEEETNNPPSVPDIQSSTPVKRHIQACNPFWSDGEEPSSDEECDTSSNMDKSSITNSTPNLRARRKPRAPPPPAIPERLDLPSTSMDDVASISSYSSHNSTIHSDQKSFGLSTPMSKKKRAAPTPPDSLSTQSGYGGSMDRGVNTQDALNTSDVIRRIKGPAPGLPLPERREVKLQMSGEELQVQLDMLETQQLGLERQGVLIEQMIRDKCEGDEGPTAPQEEIEDLVIQLCELVNEKNDLFRKQTELMYIRRQQRLEQEQADIEHEIRVIQSRPAVNRIDADKVREEQLVSRLVEIVRLRDELVQQLDAERRRERQEDLAIAASIATKRASRNSESNSSSIKSGDAITPVKKNKVKDKVKKQLRKAKHTLISKKKDEDKPEKEKKSK